MDSSNSGKHPSIQFALWLLVLQSGLGVGGCWSPSQLSLGKGGVTPWTSRWFIAGPTQKDKERLAPTATDNLNFPNRLQGMLVDCGRKPE